MERRAFIAMAEEVTASATVVENSTVALSARFRELAEAAEAQTARVERVASIARTIDVNGTAMPMADATGFVETMLGKAVAGLMDVAAQAGRMSQALAEVTAEVEGVQQCVTRIEHINRQAQFVAINATIEAHRAEGAGGTFRVIAHELKELAKETNATSKMVHERITRASRGVGQARAELSRIASTERGGLSGGQDRLNAVMAGLMAQHHALGEILDEAREAASGIDGIVSGLITGTQFQDRNAQHLNHVVEALGALGEATEALKAETAAQHPDIVANVRVDGPLLRRMLDRQSLSSVRQRFLRRLVDDAASVPEAAPAEAGDVELF